MKKILTIVLAGICLISISASANEPTNTVRRAGVSQLPVEEIRNGIAAAWQDLLKAQREVCTQAAMTGLNQGCQRLVARVDRLTANQAQLEQSDFDELKTRAEDLRRESRNHGFIENAVCRPYAQEVRNCYAEFYFAIVELRVTGRRQGQPQQQTPATQAPRQ